MNDIKLEEFESKMCEERHSQMRPGDVKLVRDEEGRTGEENGSGEGWEWGGESLAGWLAGWLWRATSRNAATDARRVSGGQAVKRAPLDSPGHPAGVESVKARWERGNGGNGGFAWSPGL